MTDKRRVGGCRQCGSCCRDFVIDVQIGNVTDFEFTDYLRWINCHENVHASIKSFKGRTAEIMIRSPCRHLVDNGDGTFSCAIQDEKPEICRRYPEEDYDDEISAKCGFRFVDVQKGPD
jgi:Fe-S-cluster containining protein